MMAESAHVKPQKSIDIKTAVTNNESVHFHNSLQYYQNTQ